MSEDLTKCPQCGGEADNGIDRCIPPSAYMCSKCCAQEEAAWQAALQESEAGAGDCVCGEPESPNTVHRSDGPCYQSSQECEAGTVAAYVMKAQLETMKRCGSVYVHLRSCLGQQVRPNSEYTALFEAPPSAQAIETAAIMKCAEVCENIAMHSSDRDGRTELVWEAVAAIKDLIPQDGRTQLAERSRQPQR